MAVDPNVLMTIPAIVAGRPYESGAWRWNFDDARRGRCNVDLNSDARQGRSHGAHEQCRHNSEASYKNLHGISTSI
jgi:hypothetical protein